MPNMHFSALQEYPGADDRGGAEEDGKNFTLLLEELKAAIKEQPLEYVVSFTTPTSFWYLRHFDLKASTAAVDFVNIMSKLLIQKHLKITL